MRVALLSREYPPEVYGGAGTHVEHLAAVLASLVDVHVHCFGAERPPTPEIEVTSYQPWERLEGKAPLLGALQAMSVDLSMAATLGSADIVHSHTWYTYFAGYLAKLLYDVPHVMTVHSLEPKRPWKVEQLGPGYRLSTFCERTSLETADVVIAVSKAVAADIVECYPAVDPARITVIPNAADPREFHPDPGTDVLERFGIDPTRPIVVCAGRTTRQKGLAHLLDAAAEIDPSAQIVLRVGQADTPDIDREIGDRITALSRRRTGVTWIKESVDQRSLVQLISHAAVACVPSVYEPFGLVNVEAMACEVPVVASAVGGIPEVVEHGVTGLLVPFEPVGPSNPEPANPAEFAHEFAASVNKLLEDPGLAREMGQAGRRRVIERFSWEAVAQQTVSVYRSLVPAIKA